MASDPFPLMATLVGASCRPLAMGFLGDGLGLLVGGYVLGIWTACTVFRDRQQTYEDGGPEQLWKPSPHPIPQVAWIPEPSR